MSVLRDPALVEECAAITASISADVCQLIPDQQPSSQDHDSQAAPAPPENGGDATGVKQTGLEPIDLETLASLKSLAAGMLALRPPSPNRPDFDADEAARLLRLLDEQIERTYRRFYDFVYAELPYCWRQLYTDLSLLKFSALVLGRKLVSPSEAGGDGDEEKLLDECVAVLDKALILAGGAGRERGRKAASKLLAHLDAPSFGMSSRASALPPFFPSTRPFTPPVKRPIQVVDSISMSEFQAYLNSADKKLGPEPLVLKSLLRTWPALTSRPWCSPRYLLSQTHSGRRLVPVEVGRSYVDEGWTQELIPFRELLRRIVATDGTFSPRAMTPAPFAQEEESANKEETNGETKTTYLAQHELLTQLPHLQNDVLTPDHCFTSPPPHPLGPSRDKPELELPLVNAWFGPAGTITPLHADGYHNLLCQVVGAKYVRLYSPHDSEALCPRGPDDEQGGVDMSNTSTFDVGAVEGWDADREGRDAIELEEFRGLKYWDCVLEAGDVLYIPIGWWHYVRSLSVSFSVSFWWNGDHFVGANASGYDEGAEEE